MSPIINELRTRLWKMIAVVMVLIPVAVSALDTNSIITPGPGKVALIFVDGPNTTFTPQILKILKQYHVKASFFLVGNNVKENPEVVQMILADGHTIGNHTLTHPDLTLVADADLDNEIAKTQTIIHHVATFKPICFNFPFGSSDARTEQAIKKYGLLEITNELNSYDAYRPGTKLIVDQVLNNIKAGQVITLHDGFDLRQQTVNTLPLIIEGVRKKGFDFVPICGV